MAEPEIPKLDKYYANAVTWGRKHGQALTDNTFPDQATAAGYPPGNAQRDAIIKDLKLAHIYYDMSSVMRDISLYLLRNGNVPEYLEFSTYAELSDQIYLDYLQPIGYQAQGFRNFVTGFSKSFLATSEQSKRSSVILLSENAAYARNSTPLSDTYSAARAREISYALFSYLEAEKLGASPRALKTQYVNNIFNYFNQWFGAKTYQPIVTFMVALASKTLIELYISQGDSPDSRIIPTLTNAWDNLYLSHWVPDAKAFKYQSVSDANGTTAPEVDLNLLIVPVFGFLWQVTGDRKWQERGNIIFGGGVTEFDDYGFKASGAFIGNGKQFNQQYFWSNRYVEWASNSPAQGIISAQGPSILVPAAPKMIFPVQRETIRSRFERKSWDKWSDQVAGGYPYMAQPGSGNAIFEEIIDSGALVGGAKITVSLSPELLDGAGSYEMFLSVSSDGLSFTAPVSNTELFGENFRYVKIRLEVNGDDKYLLLCNPFYVKIAVKEKDEAGSLLVLASDYGSGGTVLTFKKDYVDITSIVVTAEYQALGGAVQPQAFYTFLDVPNPTQCKFFILRSDTGAAINGKVNYKISGV